MGRASRPSRYAGSSNACVAVVHEGRLPPRPRPLLPRRVKIVRPWLRVRRGVTFPPCRDLPAGPLSRRHRSPAPRRLRWRRRRQRRRRRARTRRRAVEVLAAATRSSFDPDAYHARRPARSPSLLVNDGTHPPHAAHRGPRGRPQAPAGSGDDDRARSPSRPASTSTTATSPGHQGAGMEGTLTVE